MFLNTTITVQNQAINQLSSIQIISENLVLIVITINTVPSSLKALPKYFSSIFRVISRSSKILDVLVTSEYFTFKVFDSYAMGACLAQLDEHDIERPVAYASCNLSTAQKNYGITDKEGLAIVWAVMRTW